MPLRVINRGVKSAGATGAEVSDRVAVRSALVEGGFNLTSRATTTVTPLAGRPLMEGYGVPEHEEGLLPWSRAEEKLAAAKNYWVSTVSDGGQPHAMPVWGAWLGS